MTETSWTDSAFRPGIPNDRWERWIESPYSSNVSLLLVGSLAHYLMRLKRLQSPLRHHVRHVPRQSSVANLAPRVAGAGAAGGAGGVGAGALGLLGPGGLGGSAQAAIAGEQLKRLANELEVMR